MNSSPQSSISSLYMCRCLQLARQGRQLARPNPMVGAVIVAQGRIIGEGYHVRCGEAHAEVNAFASVAPSDEHLLKESTLYVSLEPCAHYGKTPPCADLIIRKGVKRVVVGCSDPFPEVQGRGIARMREAGIDVVVGVLEQECRWLNRRFFTFHRLQRPYIILKWAQTANGFIDAVATTGACDSEHLNVGGHPIALSTPFTQMLVHKLRSEEDAILIGRITEEREHPRLDVRHWAGGSTPRRLVVDRTHPLNLQALHDQGIQSLIVEGGARTHAWFLDRGLWDELRIETAPITVGDGTRAPSIPATASVVSTQQYDGNIITTYRNNSQGI